MWTALDQQGVFDTVDTVVTGLAERATWPIYGPAAREDQVPEPLQREGAEEQGQRLARREDEAARPGAGPVHAGRLRRCADDGAGAEGRRRRTSTKMIAALEGWSFTGPKGQQEIRASDHAMLQPMFLVQLRQNGKQVHGNTTCACGRSTRRRRRSRNDNRDQEDGGGEATPILATRDLGLDIGGARIVADVSLEVSDGELVGIIGPNGAGKTTLFNLLSGLMQPDRGTGRDRRPRRHGRAAVRRTRAGSRPHVPGLERLPAAVGAGERAPRGRVGARRDASALATGGALPARARPGRLGDRARRARGPSVLAGRAHSPTATSESSSWRWCWRASPGSSCSTSRWRASRTRTSTGSSSSSARCTRRRGRRCSSSSTGWRSSSGSPSESR